MTAEKNLGRQAVLTLRFAVKMTAEKILCRQAVLALRFAVR